MVVFSEIKRCQIPQFTQIVQKAKEVVAESGSAAEVASHFGAYWARAGFPRNSRDLGSDGVLPTDSRSATETVP